MSKLSDIDSNIYLTPVEQTENNLGSKKFDVWLCPNCGETHKEEYKGPANNKYKICPECGALADVIIAATTLKAATTKSQGEHLIEYQCKHCGHKHSLIKYIPRLSTSSSYSGRSSGGGRSSGASWGGGRSSGGSWGGGSSAGGGAGRRF